MKVSELLLEIIKKITWNDLSDKPSTFPPDNHSHSVIDITEDDTHKFVTSAEKETWNNKVNKSTTHTKTLLATGWTGDAAPYNQAITIEGMNDSKNWEVTNSTNPMMTEEELEAFSSARILAGPQSTNTINLVAYGEKPTIDIPILVIVRED